MVKCDYCGKTILGKKIYREDISKNFHEKCYNKYTEQMAYLMRSTESVQKL